MKKKITLVIVGGLLVTVLVAASVLYATLGDQFAPKPLATESSEEGGEGNAVAAPDFTVYDREGNAVKLSAFKGKPVILNFWASWCGPCKSEMPDFEEMYKQYGEDIHFVMVNLTDGSQETVDTATAFLDDTGYTFPVYFDTELDAAITYGISAVPQTFFVNADGYLVAQASGALNASGLQQGIDMVTK